MKKGFRFAGSKKGRFRKREGFGERTLVPSFRFRKGTKGNVPSNRFSFRREQTGTKREKTGTVLVPGERSAKTTLLENQPFVRGGDIARCCLGSFLRGNSGKFPFAEKCVCAWDPPKHAAPCCCWISSFLKGTQSSPEYPEEGVLPQRGYLWRNKSPISSREDAPRNWAQILGEKNGSFSENCSENVFSGTKVGETS